MRCNFPTVDVSFVVSTKALINLVLVAASSVLGGDGGGEGGDGIAIVGGSGGNNVNGVDSLLMVGGIGLIA